MLPCMQTTNRFPMETERDVAHVEYDVINYYTDGSPSINPDTVTVASVSDQVCPRANNNNNNNTVLDVVVHTRSTRDSYKVVTQLENSMAAPTATTTSHTSAGSIASAMRTKGVVNGRQRSKERSGTTPTLGVNMRVTGQCSQGGRKYMEDQFSVAYQESPLTHELEYAFFGIYDGHGGTEAALYAKEHLMLEIVKQKLFWSDNDEDVLRAIREGYIGTHFAMWREQENWPRTANGHLSTAGTTATVAFMRREKIYIGHVGDSGIVLGYQNPGERRWRAKQLTTDHKPESPKEKTRIQRSGGQVAIKSGVPRVVWNRPRDPMHRGPIKRRTLVDDIPFLAVARSLGDLWSYNSHCGEFVVSPDPDVKVVKIDPNTFRCLIFGTDGLWNVVNPQEAVDVVREKHIIGECMHEQDVMNPSKALVDKALKTWANKKMRADNTSVVTVILTPASTATTTIAGAGNKYPVSLDDLKHEELDMNLCGHIEEKEYFHDTPYSALAKRYLPPEPYRNFDYHIEEEVLEEVVEEEMEEEEEEEEDCEIEETDEQQLQLQQQEEAEINEIVVQQSKYWRKSLQQSVSTWHHTSSIRHRRNGVDDINDVQLDLPDNMDLDSHSMHYNSNTTTSSSNTEEMCGLSQQMDHSYDSYVGNSTVNASTTEYTFAESYNTLLNEQQSQRQQQQQPVDHQQQHHHHHHHQPQEHQHQQQHHRYSRSMQEILQEQQRYQQQEGYSLTQLETRHEQQKQQQLQQLQLAHNNRWPQQQQQHHQATYVEQPAELLALNALLQRERDEEQQVALEREQQQQQQQQLLLVEACSSSSPNCSSSNPSQSTFSDYAPWSEPNLPTLQDNEVSSTLPATPTPAHALINTKEEKTTPPKEIVPMEICQQELPLQSKQQPQQVIAVAIQQQQQQPPPQQQQLPTTQLRIRRPLRRYRNVPNENHQHMQTRRRQLFMPSKSKSFAPYGSNGSNSSSIISNEPLPADSSSKSSSNVSISIGSGSGVAGSTKGGRPRSVVNSSSSVMMTRRSHSLSLAGGGVSKRQLRSLDITKRTLRARNTTPAASGNTSSSNNNNKSSNSSSNNKSSNTNNNKNNSNRSTHTFNKPATPTTATTAATVAAPSGGSTRRPRRINDEQRRSQRRNTLSANQLGSSSKNSNANNSSSSSRGSGSSSQFSKPTRLQSCSSEIAACPPPSPKRLNTAVPTFAMGTRAYTAALAAAAADLNKRWSLRSSSNSSINRNNTGFSSNGVVRAPEQHERRPQQLRVGAEFQINVKSEHQAKYKRK